jgi:phosphate transport system substrate-binding protein
MDAVVFYVHPSNPLESLTLTELREILTFHTLYWTRIGFGEERIRLYMPPLSSGCNEVLRLRVLGTLGLPRKRNEFENHHRLFAALAQEPGALAFSGRAEECPVRVVPLKTDADSPAVLPTPSDVQARRYPLTHYLYLYTAGEPDEPLREFIAFVVSPAGQKIIGAARSGAVPLPFFVEAPD